MKLLIFTLLITGIIVGRGDIWAQDPNKGTGMKWGETFVPTEQLLLNENFQGYQHFFNGENTLDGNSKNEYNPDTGEITYGYKDGTIFIPILGSRTGNIKYSYVQCAFAPQWKTVYGAREGQENTEDVSNGFVEISRPDTVWSNPRTLKGHFIVDLREADFIEGMYWSHSSTGATKRGVMCEISLDNGVSWDTLRYQPGESSYALSFSKDVFSGEKTSNLFRCDPAAYGMTWEDAIYAENVMLRFVCTGIPIIQTLRLHDLKIFGTYSGTNAIQRLDEDEFMIHTYDNKIQLSKFADLELYNMSGRLVKKDRHVNMVSTNGFAKGIYIVKAKTESRSKTIKISVE